MLPSDSCRAASGRLVCWKCDFLDVSSDRSIDCQQSHLGLSPCHAIGTRSWRCVSDAQCGNIHNYDFSSCSAEGSKMQQH
uniref:Uncharacterized protein n=1 Tax=Anguilla anguilla TaxID=7936 RepID=A0A0E9WLW7_ANGAN